MDKVQIIWAEKDTTWDRFVPNPLSVENHLIRIHVPTFVQENPMLKALLNMAERAKMERFLRPQDRDTFLTSTASRKILCGFYLNEKPLEVRFGKNEHKKPWLPENQDLHFNISHSGDWVVFLFSSSPCGIDIEKIKRDFDFEGMMPSVFHPREIDWINGQNDRNRAFFKLWTIKESLLKAQGTGLINDLNQWDLTSTQKMSDPDWHVQTFSVGDDYYLSTCVKEHPEEFKYFEFAGSFDFPS